ncbi:MAG: T9SS type A sorting domain-containing protein, partial [Bacteroidota bacterium]|nr:T9SS type A sorting domain-containing protein [Bacteroidota bacterium]
INANVLGTYNLWYVATDPSGNKDSILRVVNVVDRIKPRVDLLGVNEVNLPRWKVYKDAPVALIDNLDSDSAMRPYLIISIPLPKNDNGEYFGDVPGLNTISYRVKDLSGNESEPSYRLVNVLIEDGTGLNSALNLDKFMSVYPNPSNGRINLRLVSPHAENIQVSVFDILGKLVQQQEINGQNLQANELDLSVQPKGFYVLKVQAGDKVYSKKIQVN